MVVAGHDGLEAHAFGVVVYLLVAGGDIGLGEALAHGGAEGHMTHHGYAVDVCHGLARKTAGAHAGGDDGDDVHDVAPCGMVSFLAYARSFPGVTVCPCMSLTALACACLCLFVRADAMRRLSGRLPGRLWGGAASGLLRLAAVGTARARVYEPCRARMDGTRHGGDVYSSLLSRYPPTSCMSGCISRCTSSITRRMPCPRSVVRMGVIFLPTLGMKAYGVIW